MPQHTATPPYKSTTTPTSTNRTNVASTPHPTRAHIWHPTCTHTPSLSSQCFPPKTPSSNILTTIPPWSSYLFPEPQHLHQSIHYSHLPHKLLHTIYKPKHHIHYSAYKGSPPTISSSLIPKNIPNYIREEADMRQHTPSPSHRSTTTPTEQQ